jgi:hypothetical protein
MRLVRWGLFRAVYAILLSSACLTPKLRAIRPPGLNESKRNVNNLNLLEGIKSASVSSETLVFYSDSKNYSSAKRMYYASLIRLNFDPSVKIVRSYGPENTTKVAVGIDQVSSRELYGIVRVVCTSNTAVHIYESYPMFDADHKHRPEREHGQNDWLQRYLMPVGRQGNKHVGGFVTVKDSEIVWVLLSTEQNDFLYASHPESDAKGPTCELRFLDADEQPKAAEYGTGGMYTSEPSGRIRGSFPLHMSNRKRMPGLSAGNEERLKGGETRSKLSYQSLTQILSLSKKVTYGPEKHTIAAHRFQTCVNIPSVPGAPVNDTIEKGSKGKKRTRTLLQNPNGEANAMIQPADINKKKKFDLMVPVLGFMLPLAPGLIGQTIAQVGFNSQMQIQGQQAVHTSVASVSHQIYRQLTQALREHLVANLIPPLHESIADEATEATVELIEEYVTKTMPNVIKDPIAAKISEAVLGTVPGNVQKEAPMHTSRIISKQLSHTLSRSLTHALVPSLIHAVSHNPLQDYYCYYCFHKKVYCQYCTYSPSQLYYAMYYAGFYSTYYGDYYTEWMDNEWSESKREDTAD